MKETTAGNETKTLFPIGVVARRTGLSKDVLRVWESRYGVVKPARSESGRRLYSDAEIERLNLLRAATTLGWSIGEVAARSVEELQELVKPGPAAIVPGVPEARGGGATPAEIVAESFAAVEEMAAERLDAVLSRALMELPGMVFLEQVIGALLEEIGERWRNDRLDPAQEHLASVSVRTALTAMITAIPPNGSSPRILLATMAGEDHELGALMAAATAATSGWRAIYIGADLPAADIATAIRRTGAQAVGLSIVAAEGNDTDVAQELATLRAEVGTDVRIFVGGRGAARYQDVVRRIGAEPAESLQAFRDSLMGARS